MADGLDELTEKEKEALRLLLAGHDAKSSARELDLSVHTVNDRLRNARRKMSVSSSREAARILGDAEGAAPQNPAHNTIGIATKKPTTEDEDIAKEAKEGISTFAWRTKGVLIMSISASILAVAAIATVSLDSPAGDVPSEAVEASQGTASNNGQAPATAPSLTPEQVAMAWLALIDNGFADEAREQAATALQNRYSAQLWELGITLRLNNQGAPVARRLLTVESTSQAEDGATGDFQTLVYHTDFVDSPNAREEIVLMREDGEWRVADYDLLTEDEREAMAAD